MQSQPFAAASRKMQNRISECCNERQPAVKGCFAVANVRASTKLFGEVIGQRHSPRTGQHFGSRILGQWLHTRQQWHRNAAPAASLHKVSPLGKLKGELTDDKVSTGVHLALDASDVFIALSIGRWHTQVRSRFRVRCREAGDADAEVVAVPPTDVSAQGVRVIETTLNRLPVIVATLGVAAQHEDGTHTSEQCCIQRCIEVAYGHVSANQVHEDRQVETLLNLAASFDAL
mmetsp:Transcript_50316/g.130978  ORF Transcript_50316/g.130978 Transcript_50316/m.130978 type:complete len:231 (+) Transcript_50316:431-1123(+)